MSESKSTPNIDNRNGGYETNKMNNKYLPPDPTLSDNSTRDLDMKGKDKYKSIDQRNTLSDDSIQSIDSREIAPVNTGRTEQASGHAQGRGRQENIDAIYSNSTSNADSDSRNYINQGHVRSYTSSFDYMSHDDTKSHAISTVEGTYLKSEGDYYYVKQKFGVCSIALSILQLLTLSVMMALCGVAPFNVNPMVGPYPDAISSWGGKNTYLLLQGEYWRFLSPTLLHSGVIHLFCNVVVQLETGAFFEREWGSTRWIFIYLLCSFGSTVTSCCFDPNQIAVGSSAPVMGLLGAKLSEVISLSFFETVRGDRDYGYSVRMEQLSGVLCSLAIVSLFAFFPLVDWCAHMGGFATGFFVGMMVFARYIRSWTFTILWGGIGLFVTLFALMYGVKVLYNDVTPLEELGDACDYFTYLHTEGYDCQCLA